MRRLIPYEEWNKLKENIAFDGTKTEIGGALEVDGEATINYLRSNVNYWNLEGEQGTLDEATFQALMLYNTDGIVNDNELYHLAHTTEQGVVVYSHISQDSQQAWNVKAITINENNLSWVKTTQAIGGGGGSLYQHNLTWSYAVSGTTQLKVLMTIINQNATAITMETLKNYMTAHNMIDGGHALKAVGYSTTYLVCGLYYTGEDARYIKALYTNKNDNADGVVQLNVGNGVLYDNVIALS